MAPAGGDGWHCIRDVCRACGGRKRIVPIDPKLYPILLAAFTNAGEGAERICDVNSHCLWRNFTVIRKHAGLPAWEDAFQVMRRNCETDWAQRFPQYAVSEWIGHDITVSAIHYLAVTPELYEKAAGVSGGSPTPGVPKVAEQESGKQ